MATKLTPMQRVLLLELSQGRLTPAARSYNPAKVLVRLGLASWEEMRYGEALKITDAGRAVLAEQADGGEG